MDDGIPKAIECNLFKFVFYRLMTVILGILLLGCFWFWINTPPQPESWEKIKIGIHRAEVYDIEPKFDSGMWELKGFDSMSSGDEEEGWQCILRYDNKDRVSRIEKRPYGGYGLKIIEE